MYMTTLDVNTWQVKEYAFGYLVRTDYTDSATGKIYSETFLFNEEPNQSDIDALVEKKRLKLIDKIDNPPVEDKIYTETEVTDILRDKGYLKQDETFNDLPKI